MVRWVSRGTQYGNHFNPSYLRHFCTDFEANKNFLRKCVCEWILLELQWLVLIFRGFFTAFSALNKITVSNALYCLVMTCNDLQCLAMPSSALQCLTMPCNNLQWLAMTFNALQWLAMPCNALQCLAIPYNALQCLAMPCNDLQWLTVICNAL